MNSLPLLASRIFNTPLLLHPGTLDAIVSSLGERLLGQTINVIGANHVDRPKPLTLTGYQGERAKAGYRILDGVGIIDMAGLLANRSAFSMQTCEMIMGYQDVAYMLDAALADRDVESILFMLDTPGGEAAGAFDLANKIYAARGQKPMAAIASDMAASAGYLIGSAVGRMAVTQTATAGSIGVVMRHVDMSEAAKQAGMSVTYMYAGDHKVDGNPYQPLPDSVRADFQASINKLYGMFVDAVALQRDMDRRDVIDTQARCYTGDDAVKAGLADEVSTPDQMIQSLRGLSTAPLSSRAGARASHSRRNPSMSEHEQGAENPAAAFTQADVDRARAAGHAEGLKAGMEQERARVSGIMAHEAAQGRTELAQTCVSQGLTVEQAAALLAASPKAATAQAAAPNAFAQAMNSLGNPSVSAASGQETTAEAEAQGLVSSMLATVSGKAYR